jgi:hypothetical protein
MEYTIKHICLYMSDVRPTLLLVDLKLAVEVDTGDDDVGQHVDGAHDIEHIWVIERHLLGSLHHEATTAPSSVTYTQCAREAATPSTWPHSQDNHHIGNLRVDSHLVSVFSSEEQTIELSVFIKKRREEMEGKGSTRMIYGGIARS